MRSAFDARQSAHPSRRLVLFESYAPWKDHLYDVEKDAQISGDALVLYVVYPDETAGSWRVQAVTKEGEAFTNRKSLPEPCVPSDGAFYRCTERRCRWRGVRDDKLSEVTGIPGGIFVHASGFIGGDASKFGPAVF